MGAWDIRNVLPRLRGGCRAVWAEALQGWRAALPLLKKDVWKPALVVGLVFLLPSFLVRQAGSAGALMDLLRRAVCLPLLYAALAHMQLSQLRRQPAAPLQVVRAKALRWRELAPLALASLIAGEMGQFAIEIIGGLLSMVLSLIAWIPIVGGVLGTLMQWALLAFGIALQMATYSLWLVQERDGGTVMPTIVTAIAFLRSRMRPLIGLVVTLTVVRGALILLTPWQVWLVGEALCLLLGTAFMAALFDGAPNRWGGGYDPYDAPSNLNRMKRANPED